MRQSGVIQLTHLPYQWRRPFLTATPPLSTSSLQTRPSVTLQFVSESCASWFIHSSQLPARRSVQHGRWCSQLRAHISDLWKAVAVATRAASSGFGPLGLEWCSVLQNADHEQDAFHCAPTCWSFWQSIDGMAVSLLAQATDCKLCLGA